MNYPLYGSAGINVTTSNNVGERCQPTKSDIGTGLREDEYLSPDVPTWKEMRINASKKVLDLEAWGIM